MVEKEKPIFKVEKTGVPVMPVKKPMPVDAFKRRRMKLPLAKSLGRDRTSKKMASVFGKAEKEKKLAQSGKGVIKPIKDISKTEEKDDTDEEGYVSVDKLSEISKKKGKAKKKPVKEEDDVESLKKLAKKKKGDEDEELFDELDKL